MATKPRDYFSYFDLPLPKQLLYQIRVLLLEWFRSCHLKKTFFKIESCRGNQTKWPPVIKHINWVENHNCQIWLTSLHWLWRKCNLTIFPLKVYESFLLPWQPNQKADCQTFHYFELSLAKQHLYQIRVLLLQWFWRRCYLKDSFFFKFNVAMATLQNGHWSSNTQTE